MSLLFLDGGSSGWEAVCASFGSVGMDSSGTGFKVAPSIDPFVGAGLDTVVSWSSWGDGPLGLPSCMTCSRRRQGPSMAGDPSYPDIGAAKV